jgi:hypothetical protein
VVEGEAVEEAAEEVVRGLEDGGELAKVIPPEVEDKAVEEAVVAAEDHRAETTPMDPINSHNLKAIT